MRVGPLRGGGGAKVCLVDLGTFEDSFCLVSQREIIVSGPGKWVGPEGSSGLWGCALRLGAAPRRSGTTRDGGLAQRLGSWAPQAATLLGTGCGPVGNGCTYSIFSWSCTQFGEKDKARAKTLGFTLFPGPCPLSAMTMEQWVLSSHANWYNSKKFTYKGLLQISNNRTSDPVEQRERGPNGPMVSSSSAPLFTGRWPLTPTGMARIQKQRASVGEDAGNPERPTGLPQPPPTAPLISSVGSRDPSSVSVPWSLCPGTRSAGVVSGPRATCSATRSMLPCHEQACWHTVGQGVPSLRWAPEPPHP